MNNHQKSSKNHETSWKIIKHHQKSSQNHETSWKNIKHHFKKKNSKKHDTSWKIIKPSSKIIQESWKIMKNPQTSSKIIQKYPKIMLKTRGSNPFQPSNHAHDVSAIALRSSSISTSLASRRSSSLREQTLPSSRAWLMDLGRIGWWMGRFLDDFWWCFIVVDVDWLVDFDWWIFGWDVWNWLDELWRFGWSFGGTFCEVTLWRWTLRRL